MAALDFPNPPLTVGQQYAAPNGVTYQWDGAAWVVTGGPPGQLWTGTATSLTPTDPTKSVTVPGGAAGAGSALLALGSNTAKARIATGNTTTPAYLALTVNRDAIAGTQDDATKPSWQYTLNAQTDATTIARQPAGGASATLLTLDNTGGLSLAGGLSVGTGVTATRIQIVPRAGISAEGNVLDCMYNDPSSAFYNIANPGWTTRLQGTGADIAGFMRRAANQGAYAFYLSIDGSGNLVIAGPNATKSAGTVWINPSDRRIKKNVAPYTRGLAAIVALKPTTFEFNGLGGSQDGLAGIGLIADDVQSIMPEMVSVTPTKLAADDASPVDLLTLDTSALTMALVNAIKELMPRLEALEAHA